MKHLSNEQKAKEIAEHSAYLSDFPHDKKSVMYGALEAMKWKDEQEIEFLRDIVESIDLITAGNLSHRISNIKCMLFSRIALLSNERKIELWQRN